ncbi:unnamed protein product [Oppiella nova]|uniref:Cation efflux protein transmembrane domain-containing protein n=1 Tax=Oppiella nova TaxID=334625 RepID=A0A7R9L9S8_9ACAR|nr:unnamed protein product [Oppiella nova]CAG2160404.1 unnamed protein product [Oppiella nova]
MFTDAAALAIALVAIKIGKLPADDKRTFGYQRFEILAALFNAMMLFVVAIYILYEAYQRFSQPPEIQSVGMMVVAVIGLVINLISMKILFSSSKESLNIKGAYLEVLSDALGSVGVIIGGAIIYFTGWMWVDTIIAVLIGFWVLPRTWVLLKQSINILLEEADRNQLYQQVMEMLSHQHGITEMTLQIEDNEQITPKHYPCNHSCNEDHNCCNLQCLTCTVAENPHHNTNDDQ